MEVLEAVKGIKDAYVQQHIQKALATLRRAFVLYPPDHMAFSFNGGKDSTVLLHLLRAAAHQVGLDCDMPGQSPLPNSSTGLGGVRSFYFRRDDDFVEVQQFVEAMDKRYSLHVDYMSDPDFKAGLQGYIQQTSIKAIVLGTRRGDPNAWDQEVFCPSSEGWPPFMRINPIMDWGYHDVWTFLRATHAPYCCLYDQGYTSLGAIHNTLPNSVLMREDGSFAPAYLLPDTRLERAGRSSTYRRTNSISSPSAGVAPALTRSAALLVVGDELLSGKVEDSNTHFLCRELRALGWQVSRVVIVPDDVDSIAAELRSLVDNAELVITSGGVGPTLDDVTVAGVAKAMGQPLVRNPEFVQRLQHYFGESLTAAHLKLAETPGDGCELLDYRLDSGEISKFPLMRCADKVYVLPGVPHLLRQKWRAIRDILTQQSCPIPFRNKVLRLAVADEAKIAPLLESVDHAFGSEVKIGSYPVTDQADGASLLITMDSKNLGALHLAVASLRSQLPEGAFLDEETDVNVLSAKNSMNFDD